MTPTDINLPDRKPSDVPLDSESPEDVERKRREALFREFGFDEAEVRRLTKEPTADGNGDRGATEAGGAENAQVPKTRKRSRSRSAARDSAGDANFLDAAPVTTLIRADDATAYLLGLALFDPEIAERVARSMSPADFPDSLERRVFSAIVTVLSEGHKPDVVTVLAAVPHETQALRAHLYTLLEVRGLADNVEAYIAIIKEGTAKRRLATALLKIREIDVNGSTASELHHRVEETWAEAVPASVGDKIDRVPMYNGIEVASMGIVEAEPVIAGIAYVAQSTLFMGAGKGGGKTTALVDMSRERIAGRSWCGQRVKPGGVLYLTEQTPASFNPQVARAGLLGSPDFHVIYHCDVAEAGLTWPDVGELVLRKTAETGDDLVIIDTYAQWVGFVGEDENGSGPALEALLVIERWKARGLSVIGSAHTRKEAGSIYEAARGSTATPGGFDMLARIRRTSFSRRRIIDAVGRPFAEDPDDVTIELDVATHRYRRAGSTADTPRAVILGLFPELGIDHALTEADIIAACKDLGIGRPTASAALRKLCDPAGEQLMDRRYGAGSAGSHALGYWRCADREPGQLFNSTAGPCIVDGATIPDNSAANSTAAQKDLLRRPENEPDNSTARRTEEL